MLATRQQKRIAVHLKVGHILVLEVGVDGGLGRLGESRLGTVIGVAEIMAVTCRLEVEAQRVVGGVTAAV